MADTAVNSARICEWHGLEFNAGLLWKGSI
jgi:hypothetical protein